MDLFETSDPSDNSPIYSVSELSGALKKTVESAFSLVRVRGEIGRVTRPASGHVYLDIKDANAVINCNLWRGVASKIGFLPEEGMEVIATGKLSTYAPQSKYNLIIESLEIAGEGALLALLEKRKKALAGEGLFDPARKQELPFLPARIGVITSRSGAVIRDILHRISDRFPVEVILWPVTVQGENCAPEVTRAIEGFNALPIGHPLRPDVLIVARGGGAIEDLWGFNEEIVVRAAANSHLPLISAVGHETDTTLIDYAADKRAPTPTAAAEMAVPVRADLIAAINDLEARRLRAVSRTLSQNKQKLRDLARALPSANSLTNTPHQRLDLATTRLSSSLERQAMRARQRLTTTAQPLRPQLLAALLGTKDQALKSTTQNMETSFARRYERAAQSLNSAARALRPSALQQLVQQKARDLQAQSALLTPAFARETRRKSDALQSYARLLQALSHKRILARGFALVRDEGGTILPNAKTAGEHQKLTIEFADGALNAALEKE